MARWVQNPRSIQTVLLYMNCGHGPALPVKCCVISKSSQTRQASRAQLIHSWFANVSRYPPRKRGGTLSLSVAWILV